MLLARRTVQEAGQWNAVGAESGLVARALGPFHHPACVKGVRMRTKSLLANAEGVICLSNPLTFSLYSLSLAGFIVLDKREKKG